MSRAKEGSELEKEPIGVERKVTILPRSGSIGRQPARQRSVGRRDYHNRNGVIEKRIVPQRQTNIDSAQLVELLVEHQNIVPSAPSELERLFTGPRSGHVISLLRENALQRPTHPFVVASDQSNRSS